jgi:NAD-dependent SIR2 family protein deacetylase
MFDILWFADDPRAFFAFAKEIFPGSFTPSASHRFIKLLEEKGKLLRNYTQNIDTLEQVLWLLFVAGWRVNMSMFPLCCDYFIHLYHSSKIHLVCNQVAKIKNVVQCHGSFATATCLECRKTFNGAVADSHALPFADMLVRHRNGLLALRCVAEGRAHFIVLCAGEVIRTDVYAERVPYCKCGGIIKPDIVFFHENLPDTFYDSIIADQSKVDLFIVMGSSLKVQPQLSCC